MPMAIDGAWLRAWSFNGRRRQTLVRCAENSSILAWMRSVEPCEVLGITSQDFSLQDVKSAFRSKVKEYHPDVYRGPENAEAITQCLIQAYEQLVLDVKEGSIQTTSSDPFEEPEGEADDVFVNELLCIGKACPYACVQRAPSVFIFAEDTGCGRALVQGKGGDYNVQLAVGQCPRNCIHFVTGAQRKVLEPLLSSILTNPVSSQGQVMTMQGLIARAKFENGRYRGPKRKPKRSSRMVDHY